MYTDIYMYTVHIYIYMYDCICTCICILYTEYKYIPLYSHLTTGRNPAMTPAEPGLTPFPIHSAAFAQGVPTGRPSGNAFW